MFFEVFLFLSAFVISYKTFQRLQANQNFAIIDLVKIIAMKAWRLAVPYYSMLLVLMAVNSRIINGPNWDTETTNSFGDCKRTWLPTLLFVGNLYPNYEILKGCYPQAYII